jgi:hypothetical protein
MSRGIECALNAFCKKQVIRMGALFLARNLDITLDEERVVTKRHTSKRVGRARLRTNPGVSTVDGRRITQLSYQRHNNHNQVSTMASGNENRVLNDICDYSTYDDTSLDHPSIFHSVDGLVAGLDCDMQLSSFGGHIHSLEWSDALSHRWEHRVHFLPSLPGISKLIGTIDGEEGQLYNEVAGNEFTICGDSNRKDVLSRSKMISTFMNEIMRPALQPSIHLPDLRQIFPIELVPSKSLSNAEAHNPTKPTTVERKKGNRKYEAGRVVPEDTIEYFNYYNKFDVICGRGERSNQHPGNRFYLGLVNIRKPLYRKGSAKEKVALVLEVLSSVRERGGRILRLDKKADATIRWYVSDERKALEKVRQALRDNNDDAARATKRAKGGSNRQRRPVKANKKITPRQA